MNLRTHTHTLTEYRKYVKNVWASWFHLFTTIWAQQMLLFLTTWLDFNSKSQDCACKLARALRERERARRERNARERAQEMPATCCCLLSSLSSHRRLLSLWSVSLFVALSVLFASSRQIVLASSLIRLHQSAFKRDGVHLVEPIGAVYNSRVCVYVCVCEWVSAKWFLPFKLTTINILSNELVSVLYHHTPPTHSFRN